VPGRVLLVSADPAVQAPLLYRLALERYAVLTALTESDALACLRAGPVDVVLLHASAPDVECLAVLRRLQQHPALRGAAVVVVLSDVDEPRVAERARVSVLSAGADDVVHWSDSLDELVLRLLAIGRRAAAGAARAAPDVIEVDALRVDVAARDVTVAGRPVSLTLRQFALLHALLLERGGLLTRAALAATLERGGVVPRARAVDVQVARLRAKLGPMRELIVTVPGEGYRLSTRVRASA